MNPIKKIMSTKYKYAFVAAIIMIVMFVLGVIVIQGMTNVITEQKITYTDTIVSGKYLDESNGHFYIVVGNDNKTFDIEKNNQGTKIYDAISTGQHYRFIVRNNTNSPIMDIIQVYNDTN